MSSTTIQFHDFFMTMGFEWISITSYNLEIDMVAIATSLVVKYDWMMEIIWPWLVVHIIPMWTLPIMMI